MTREQLDGGGEGERWKREEEEGGEGKEWKWEGEREHV